VPTRVESACWAPRALSSPAGPLRSGAARRWPWAPFSPRAAPRARASCWPPRSGPTRTARAHTLSCATISGFYAARAWDPWLSVEGEMSRCGRGRPLGRRARAPATARSGRSGAGRSGALTPRAEPILSEAVALYQEHFLAASPSPTASPSRSGSSVRKSRCAPARARPSTR